MKMKAVILFKAGAPAPYKDSRPLRVEEVDLDPPQTNEVLVRIGGAGLCHSDLSIINASVPRALPMVLGHEGSGEVVEVGGNVTDVKAGDHVVFQFRFGSLTILLLTTLRFFHLHHPNAFQNQTQ